ncbi:hypothetical protein KRX57_08505 [Weeksellaceae bacterium TAE3-ERU29]|nr:hypothetical protein [Weeksellaceae bacterium TAE3-ERU29]
MRTHFDIIYKETIERELRIKSLLIEQPSRALGKCLSLKGINEIYFLKEAVLDNKVLESKQFLYVIGLLNSYYAEFGNRDIFEVLNTFTFPVLSDNVELINRYMNYKPTIYKDTFATYFGKSIQAVISKDDETLSMNIKGLQKHSKGGWEKHFSGIVTAFKGFLYGDKLLIENGIEELLDKHNKQEHPTFVKDFINYEATTINKLSNYINIPLNINHILMPKELLPIKPLDNYEIPYDFLKVN